MYDKSHIKFFHCLYNFSIFFYLMKFFLIYLNFFLLRINFFWIYLYFFYIYLNFFSVYYDFIKLENRFSKKSQMRLLVHHRRISLMNGKTKHCKFPFMDFIFNYLFAFLSMGLKAARSVPCIVSEGKFRISDIMNEG